MLHSWTGLSFELDTKNITRPKNTRVSMYQNKVYMYSVLCRNFSNFATECQGWTLRVHNCLLPSIHTLWNATIPLRFMISLVHGYSTLYTSSNRPLLHRLLAHSLLRLCLRAQRPLSHGSNGCGRNHRKDVRRVGTLSTLLRRSISRD